MRSIPVKESAFVGLVCVMAPEAKLVDLDTGEVKKDRRSGQTVWTVGVCAMRGRDSSVIQVAVVGEPAGLGVGMPVRVVELEAAPWERDGRSGIAWRAQAILPAAAAIPSPAGGPDQGAELGAAGMRSAGPAGPGTTRVGGAAAGSRPGGRGETQ
jgi:hypothetical protein